MLLSEQRAFLGSNPGFRKASTLGQVLLRLRRTMQTGLLPVPFPRKSLLLRFLISPNR